MIKEFVRILRAAKLQTVVFHHSYTYCTLYSLQSSSTNPLPIHLLFPISFSFTLITYLLTSSAPSCLFLLSVNTYLYVSIPILLYTYCSLVSLLSSTFHIPLFLFHILFSLVAVFFLTARHNLHRVKDLPLIMLTPFRNFIFSPPAHQRTILFERIFLYYYSFVSSKAAFFSFFLCFFRHIFIHSEINQATKETN